MVTLNVYIDQIGNKVGLNLSSSQPYLTSLILHPLLLHMPNNNDKWSFDCGGQQLNYELMEIS